MTIDRTTTSRSPETQSPRLPAIFLVEDDAAIRALVTRLLTLKEYRVLAAEHAAGALPMWTEHRDEIDLLLTDLVLPGSMTGRELAAHCQRDRPDLKVIFTSGYNMESCTSGDWLREGLNFLQKPYRPEQLIEAVRTMLASPPNLKSKTYVAGPAR
jgi:CheY-like chemotaxis protein